MKMRNKLAALLATSMVVTAVPVVTMAAKDEVRMSGVVTVTEDTKLNEKTAPKLTIEDTYGDWKKGNTIWLELENAEWLDGVGASILEVRDADGKLVEGEDLFIVDKEDDEVLRITKNFDSVGPITLRVSMQVEIAENLEDGEEVLVSVDGGTTGVTSEDDILLAEITSDALKVKAGAAKKFATRSVDINDITISENYAGGFKKGDQIVLSMASGFEWDVDTTTSSAIKIDYGTDDLEFEYDKDSDETDLILNVVKADSNRTSASRIKLTNLALRTEDRNSTDYGDVKVDVSGDSIEDTTIVVAKYMDYGSEAEVEEVKDILAGRVVELEKVTLSENVADSINFNRNLEVSFPEGVNVVGVSAKLGSKDVTDVFEEAFEITKDRLDEEGRKREFINEGIVNLGEYVKDSTKAQELKVEFEVETAVDFTGDMVVTFGGRAVDYKDVEIKVATVQAPIKVEAETKKINFGVKDQSVGKITITENAKGALQKGTLLVGFEGLSYGRWEDEPTVTVTNGNVKIGNVKLLSNGLLAIEIKSDSRTASTIEITDGVITTSRAIADGKYALEIGGDAIVANEIVDSKWADCIKVDYLEVGDLKAEQAEQAEQEKAPVKSSFTIGQATYTIGESTELMDAAPYISEDNRTMVPLRYAAYALGIDEDNILYDNVNSIVTIFNGDKVVQIQAGSKVMLLNGTTIPMDTEVVIKDGRTFLPISWVARALGVTYSWDSATGTVTFN